MVEVPRLVDYLAVSIVATHAYIWVSGRPLARPRASKRLDGRIATIAADDFRCSGWRSGAGPGLLHRLGMQASVDWPPIFRTSSLAGASRASAQATAFIGRAGVRV